MNFQVIKIWTMLPTSNFPNVKWGWERRKENDEGKCYKLAFATT